MLGHRLLSICIAAGLGSISLAAHAQDCDRFFWQCQGWSGPSAPAPREVAPPSMFTPDVIVPRRVLPPPVEAEPLEPVTPADPAMRQRYAALYASVPGEPFPIPAVKLSEVNPAFLRTVVDSPFNEAPGTIIVDPHRHYLYLIESDGRAIRYGVGVGRQGFGWSGVATVHNKQEWPDWYPPKEMLDRQPELRRQMSQLQSGIGMSGGPRNPLGARALYLWQGNKDTLYRIHGTVEPWTIGKSVSSGCIRMINQDVLDLYQRVAVGAKVVVLP
jgi:lipoprotein-anchoring transpeptidase ErfK/SrfK